jgi:hypothetical protein
MGRLVSDQVRTSLRHNPNAGATQESGFRLCAHTRTDPSLVKLLNGPW